MTYQSNPRTSKWREEFKWSLLRTRHLLEFVSRNNDCHRVAMARDGLRAFRLRQLNQLAEVILCIL